MAWLQGKNKQGIDKYYLANGEFTICKIGTKPDYELWKKSERLGIFSSADLAKQHFNELINGLTK